MAFDVADSCPKRRQLRCPESPTGASGTLIACVDGFGIACTRDGPGGHSFLDVFDSVRGEGTCFRQ
ncbi:MAG: hypothetical protein A07HR60_02493 [uncultured archaeon A07HR60]|nr:MAG: hypothetical protein A07HR60_02493 [uncultured archaeon A07HR60]